ncbi:MAG TPA: DUF2844 domain-containing protein [Terriglobales bacterium]|nr:DUF2844 domain-containing protein [Terriglobales bacterium]
MNTRNGLVSAVFSSRAFPLLFLPLLLLAMVAPAWGSLGDSMASVEADRAHMHASVRVVHQGAYDVHEMSAGASVVREYVAPNGMVFGVAFQGPALPDMKQVLGNYFARYQAAQRRVRRGPTIIRESGLVVVVSGHMRSFSGRACVPEMVPSGVRVEDVR